MNNKIIETTEKVTQAKATIESAVTALATGENIFAAPEQKTKFLNALLALAKDQRVSLFSTIPQLKFLKSESMDQKPDAEKRFKNILCGMNEKMAAEKLNRGLGELESLLKTWRVIKPSLTTREILEQLGEVVEVTMADGSKYGSVAVSVDKLKTFFGMDDAGIHAKLSAVFSDCGGAKDYQTNEHGILVDVDLYQQKALLKAIVYSNQNGVRFSGWREQV